VDSLVQGIRDLDQTTFQQLCFSVMKEKYPNAGIRYPEGSAGDEGVDLFTGDLTYGSTVWQCKAFQVTVLGDSQKQQIRDSLRDAVKNVKPKVWILCLNMNMDTKAVRWFKRLQDSCKTQGVLVADPFEGLDMALELMFRRTLRTHYFPSLTIDVGGLKSLLKAAGRGIDSLDEATLEKLTTEDAEEWLDRQRDKDARFVYEVTFGGERGPAVFPPKPEPGLVSAMTDGRKIVKAYARDMQALARDPVSTRIQLTEAGEEKLLDFISTGKKQHLEPDEIRAFSSTVPLLSDINFAQGTLSIGIQALPDDMIIPLSLIFKNSDATVKLDYLEFKKIRLGVEEVEISTADPNAPLSLTLVLPTADKTKPVTVTMATHLPGTVVSVASKICAAARLLQQGCDVEVFSLKLGATLCTMSTDPLPLSFTDKFYAFVDDLNAISTRFGCDIPLPEAEEFTSENEETLTILRALALAQPLDIETFTIRLVKSEENASMVEQQFRQEMVFRFEHESARASLFGTPIQVGPTVIQIERGIIEDLEDTLDRFKRAEIGSAVPIRIHPLTPVPLALVERGALFSARL
jgi:hypothetical protein